VKAGRPTADVDPTTSRCRRQCARQQALRRVAHTCGISMCRRGNHPAPGGPTAAWPGPAGRMMARTDGSRLARGDRGWNEPEGADPRPEALLRGAPNAVPPERLPVR
jgi:hypothetical protein